MNIAIKKYVDRSLAVMLGIVLWVLSAFVILGVNAAWFLPYPIQVALIVAALFAGFVIIIVNKERIFTVIIGISFGAVYCAITYSIFRVSPLSIAGFVSTFLITIAVFFGHTLGIKLYSPKTPQPLIIWSSWSKKKIATCTSLCVAVVIVLWVTSRRPEQFLRLPPVETPTVAKLDTTKDMYAIAYGPAESTLMELHKNGTYRTMMRMHMGTMDWSKGTWLTVGQGDILLKSSQLRGPKEFRYRPITYKSFLFLVDLDTKYFSPDQLIHEIISKVDSLKKDETPLFWHHHIFIALTPKYYGYEFGRSEPFKFLK